MPSVKLRRNGKAALPPAARGRERGSRPRRGGLALLPQTEQECPAGAEPSERGGEGSGWGRGVPGDAGRCRPPPAGGEGWSTARAPATRRSPLPGLAAHPRTLPSAQARRWDLQQSLQETPGPVIRQEISALADGQAGRVRLSACSFPRWALVLLEEPRLGGNKAAPAGVGNALRPR